MTETTTRVCHARDHLRARTEIAAAVTAPGGGGASDSLYGAVDSVGCSARAHSRSPGTEHREPAQLIHYRHDTTSSPDGTQRDVHTINRASSDCARRIAGPRRV
ncbi:unnamed protein product [Arctia plantaginis]|uniref:Uncharacterized protein n=1 Tax=Arctia plantaginis TaxID=874455 RepID=A0A8S0YWC2_ARCPL|nr:unnamed protein product [Arctia plantaginis]